jgi:putative oxidoreductase
MKWLFATDDAWAPLVLRVFLGGIMLPHGLQKLLGWFGGPGVAGTLDAFTTQLGVAAPVAALVIVAESFGSLGLILGLLTRFTAAAFIVIMLGAIAIVHWPNGLFMNWFGAQAGEGFEYHLLVIGICAALLITGGGRWSLDGRIAHRLAHGGHGHSHDAFHVH